jgi:outer membrane lipoprotein-sorting protein
MTAIALFVMLIAWPAPSPGDGNLDHILSNMQRAARSIKTLRASLSHEKLYAQIGGREVYTGDIYFKHAGKNLDKLKIKYHRTGQEVLVSGNEIMLYQPSIKQAYKTTRQRQAARNQEFALLMTPYSSVQQLKQIYDITYLRDEKLDQAQTSVLELVPKSASSLQKILLWVDRSSWLPIRYQVVEKSKDVTTFTLKDIKLGVQLPDEVFRINLPKDAKIIVN